MSITSSLEPVTISLTKETSVITTDTKTTTASLAAEEVSAEEVLRLKNEKQLRYIKNEIISTEKTYLHRLEIVHEVYIVPLQTSGIIDNSEIKSQFKNWDSMLIGHRILYSEMTDSSYTIDTLQMGTIFLNISKFLTMYEDYLVNFEDAQKRRSKMITSNKRFAEFLENIKNDNKCAGYSLEALLIEPVQRIPRYRLLLEQLKKYTNPRLDEYVKVTEALLLISDIAINSNESIRKNENNTKMIEIMNKISFKTRIDFLNDDNRIFIKEGKLQRQCRRQIKDFQFWLFSDMIVYGEQVNIISSGVIFDIHRHIQIMQCRLNSSVTCPNHELAFILESPEKSFILWGNSIEDKKEWCNAILQAQKERSKSTMSCSSNADRNDSTATASVSAINASAVAPLWTPDVNVSTCQKCNVKFTIFLRRHHCRACGIIICSTCSQYKMLLSHVNANKEVRVCVSCYETLKPTAASTNAIATTTATATSNESNDTASTPRRRSITQDLFGMLSIGGGSHDCAAATGSTETPTSTTNSDTKGRRRSRRISSAILSIFNVSSHEDSPTTTSTNTADGINTNTIDDRSSKSDAINQLLDTSNDDDDDGGCGSDNIDGNTNSDI